MHIRHVFLGWHDFMCLKMVSKKLYFIHIRKKKYLRLINVHFDYLHVSLFTCMQSEFFVQCIFFYMYVFLHLYVKNFFFSHNIWLHNENEEIWWVMITSFLFGSESRWLLCDLMAFGQQSLMVAYLKRTKSKIEEKLGCRR